jgi:SAM-dependent methyltransferase
VETGDAFGRLLLDHLEGRPGIEVVERDDGFVSAHPVDGYFAPVRSWAGPERRALRFARGRVLDVGCGAGRAALELQRRGREVVAIDVSPLAVEVSRRRGVEDVRLLGLSDLDGRLGPFDAFVMFGNGFGLFGTPAKARRLLRRLAPLTSPRGRILAASTDPTVTADPLHLGLQERNRARGRPAGQLRIRVRHRHGATPWFDFLLVSPGEMAGLAEEAGWRLQRVLGDDSPYYVGVLEPR